MKPIALCSALLLLAAATPGCKPQAPAPPQSPPQASASGTQSFQVKGVVREVKFPDRSIVIRHEEIPGYMPAMTMPFDVKDTNELTGLQKGDVVQFRMLVTDDDGWIDQVRKVGVTNLIEPSKPGEARVVRFVEPLSVGDPVPDYPFTNELGKSISLAQFKGKAIALTFIFTRCPFPDFCPRMTSHFSDAVRQLAQKKDAPSNWHFLSLSFDPEFDTPATLKAYAERNQYDPKVWSFATGALIEIDAITEQFGLVFPREGINFNHNLRTVVIDATGKVHTILVGNMWKPEELVSAVIQAAQAR